MVSGSTVLGTPPRQNYNARHGILLDMVGGKKMQLFYYEGYSSETARSEMKRFGKRHMSWSWQVFC